MRVLLVPAKSDYPYNSLSFDLLAQALPYIAGTLKAHGHEVFGLNMNYQARPEPCRETLEKFLIKKIKDCQPDLIGLSGLSADYLFVRDAIAILRKEAPHVPIVGGGGLFTSDAEYTVSELRPDFAVMDEGEETILDLIQTLEQGGDPETVDGLVFLKNGRMVRTPERDSIKDLDPLPYPEYDPFDIDTYFRISNQKDNYFHARTRNRPRLMPVLAARSCPFKCTFCYVTGGKTYRIRSVPSLMQEIQYFHDRYRFNILKLYDDLFSVNKPRVREFCQELRKLNLDIHWSCTIRVADVDLDLLRDMKEAGCIHIQYGFESAHQDVLESMVKKTTVEQIRKAIEWSEEVGIGVQGNFIFGDPAETPESIEQTRDFFEKYCKDHIIHCDYITPYPGSPLFLQHCQKHGLIPDKKKYYENLHLRPRFNMTPMSYKEFRDRVEPIVRNKWIGYQPASEVSFREEVFSGREALDNPFPQRRWFHVDCLCPHCEGSVHYLFPLELDLRSPQGILKALPPITAFCSRCHKRLIIPTLPLTGLEKQYGEFRKRVNALADSGKPAVLTPVLDQDALDMHRFYGIDLHRLNTIFYLDPGHWPEGSSFLSSPVQSLDPQNIQRYNDQTFVVLPCSNYQEIVLDLVSHGVSEKDILCWPLRPQDGREKARPAQKVSTPILKKVFHRLIGAHPEFHPSQDSQAFSLASSGTSGLLVSSPSPPRLVKTLDSYNIVFYGGFYYGLPHKLGEVHLESEEEVVSRFPGVIKDHSLDQVVTQIPSD